MIASWSWWLFFAIFCSSMWSICVWLKAIAKQTERIANELQGGRTTDEVIDIASRVKESQHELSEIAIQLRNARGLQ